MTQSEFAEIDTLSGLLTVAIEDGQLMLEDDRYKAVSSEYHTPVTGKDVDCVACLAGAVMAKTLDADPGRRLSPSNYPYQVRNRLFAINALRLGELDAAHSNMHGVYGLPPPDVHRKLLGIRFRSILSLTHRNFGDDLGFEAHLAWMRRVRDDLRKAGL